MSQRFPQHYDGIVAGDPFYLPPDISLSETWGLERIIDVSPIVNGVPQYLQSFTLADQNLFTNAILAACDHLDGLVDGVIDNAAACHFDPATFVFPSSGVYGSIAPGHAAAVHRREDGDLPHAGAGECDEEDRPGPAHFQRPAHRLARRHAAFRLSVRRRLHAALGHPDARHRHRELASGEHRPRLRPAAALLVREPGPDVQPADGGLRPRHPPRHAGLARGEQPDRHPPIS